MHVSEATEFIAAALDNAQIEFNDKGVCHIETESGFAIVFVFAPPIMRLYCEPISEDEYREVEDKATFLEALLAINYESDIGSRQEFKMGFHKELGVPIVAAEMDTGDLQAEVLKTVCDDLSSISEIVRGTVVGDDLVDKEDENIEIADHEPSAFDDGSLRL